MFYISCFLYIDHLKDYPVVLVKLIAPPYKGIKGSKRHLLLLVAVINSCEDKILKYILPSESINPDYQLLLDVKGSGNFISILYLSQTRLNCNNLIGFLSSPFIKLIYLIKPSL